MTTSWLPRRRICTPIFCSMSARLRSNSPHRSISRRLSGNSIAASCMASSGGGNTVVFNQLSKVGSFWGKGAKLRARAQGPPVHCHTFETKTAAGGDPAAVCLAYASSATLDRIPDNAGGALFEIASGDGGRCSPRANRLAVFVESLRQIAFHPIVDDPVITPVGINPDPGTHGA